MSIAQENEQPKEHVAFNYSDTAQEYISLVGIKYADKSAVDAVINTLHNNSNIRSIDLTNVNMSAHWLSDVLEAAATCPNLESIVLTGNIMHEEVIDSLCKAIPQLPKLRTLECDNSGLDASACQKLFSALRGSELQVLGIRGNKPDKSGISALIETLPELPKLKKLFLANCGIDDEMFPPLAEAIATNSTLIDCELFFNPISDAQQDSYLGMLQQHHNRNLIEHTTTHAPLAEFCDANKHQALIYANGIKGLHEQGMPLSNMPCHFIPAISERLPAIDSLVNSPHLSEMLTEFLTTLPSAAKDVTHEELFTANGKGLTPMENPDTWKRISSICTELERKGTPLTTADMLKTNRSGTPHFLTAMAGTPETTLPSLNKHGIRVPVSALLEDGTPTRLLNQFCSNNAASLLFTTDNLRGESTQAVAALHKALPETQQESIGNYHALIATLSSENQQRGVGR